MWILDLLTTIGASFLALVGVSLLARSGPITRPTSAGHWFGFAVLFFVAARFLHLPPIEDRVSRFVSDVDGHHQWYNIPYVLTITCTTIAIVYCVPAVAWLSGGNVKAAPPHGFAALTAAVLLTSFATSGLWRQPHDYLPDAFRWSISQVVFWGYVALAIASVGVIALGLIAYTLRELTNPFRPMMLLIASSAVTAVLFALHIVLRVFAVQAIPGLFPAVYVHNSAFIAVLLTTLVTIQLFGAFLVPVWVRYSARVRDAQMLWRSREAWTESRQLEHRNVFSQLEIPETAWQCWRAAREPVVVRRMLFEMSTV